MPTSFPVSQKNHHTRSGRHLSAMDIDDLALMLQIDLLLDDKNGFHRRLKYALEESFRRGSHSSR